MSTVEHREADTDVCDNPHSKYTVIFRGDDDDDVNWTMLNYIIQPNNVHTICTYMHTLVWHCLWYCKNVLQFYMEHIPIIHSDALCNAVL